jgi:hypothetical protein
VSKKNDKGKSAKPTPKPSKPAKSGDDDKKKPAVGKAGRTAPPKSTEPPEPDPEDVEGSAEEDAEGKEVDPETGEFRDDSGIAREPNTTDKQIKTTVLPGQAAANAEGQRSAAVEHPTSESITPADEVKEGQPGGKGKAKEKPPENEFGAVDPKTGWPKKKS